MRAGEIGFYLISATLALAVAVLPRSSLLAAALFVAGGIPMIIEYVSRVQKAHKKDHEQAQEQRKNLP